MTGGILELDSRREHMLKITRASEATTPEPMDGPVLHLTDNARTVLMKRYVRRGPDGKPIETPEGMFRRIARAIAGPEADHGGDVTARERAVYCLRIGNGFFST